ncbi:MAG: hypothetical protein N3A62_06570 [Thermodesulfovibrionales bacterium]|nr:hypothetical protein [Thermodesulfovibrionales bacterium]
MQEFGGSIKIYVVDKDKKTIYSTKGQVVDKTGIILTDIKSIQRWLDDISNNLIAIDTSGRVFNIHRLIATHSKGRFAIISLDTNGALLYEKKISQDYIKYTDFIGKAITTFKKKSSYIQPEIQPKQDTPPLKPMEIQPPSIYTFEHYKQQGYLLLSERRYKEAEDMYLKALSIRGLDVGVLKSLALINTLLGRFEDAVRYYKMIARYEDSSEILKKISNLYILLEQYTMAERCIKKALSLNHFDAQLHYTLAILKMLSGDKEQAYKQYITLNKLNKDKAEEVFDILFR